MAASKFTRNKDYSDEADSNAGGRDTVDPAGLDGEMDELKTTTDDHADKLDLLLRDDLRMVANILQGHEFSPEAIAVLSAVLGYDTVMNYREGWVTATDYAIADLVSINNNTYFCLVAHTSDVFSTDLGAARWFLFASGAAGLPVGAAVDDVLHWNGAAAWGKITALMAPLHALLANPTFTGVVGLPDVNVAGRFNLTSSAVTFSAASQALDFDTTFLKTIDVTGNYTSAITASNITQGDMQEVHFDNTSGADAAVLWDSNWVWMGYAPALLPSGKKAVLSLRAPTGAAATDIIAMWSVEP